MQWRAVFIDGLAGVAEINALFTHGYIVMRCYKVGTGRLFLLAFSDKAA